MCIPIEYNFPLYSPNIISINIIYKYLRFIFKSKLYIYREMPKPKSRIIFIFSTFMTKFILFISLRISNFTSEYKNYFLYKYIRKTFFI
jgi:hypothetical protein